MMEDEETKVMDMRSVFTSTETTGVKEKKPSQGWVKRMKQIVRVQNQASKKEKEVRKDIEIALKRLRLYSITSWAALLILPSFVFLIKRNLSLEEVLVSFILVAAILFVSTHLLKRKYKKRLRVLTKVHSPRSKSKEEVLIILKENEVSKNTITILSSIFDRLPRNYNIVVEEKLLYFSLWIKEGSAGGTVPLVPLCAFLKK